MADLQKLAEEIQGLTLLEASELVKILESKLGVTAAAPAEVEEKTEFDVLLTEVGAKKIQVIKVVRQLTNLGLKESKDLVDGAPSTVLQGVSKEAAEDAKAKLEAEGATVTTK